jgi:hypothetical protein
MYYDAEEKTSHCQFPYYHHKTTHHIRKKTDEIMDKLFSRKYRYNGFFYPGRNESDESEDTCFVFYEVRYVKSSLYYLLQGKDRNCWHWVTTPEIIYHQKYIFTPIDETIVSLFHLYPTIGVLQATSSVNQALIHIELPTILYYGSDICYARNTAIYGIKREPIISRYGPFYYFTTLLHSFFWACYHFSEHKGRTQEREVRNNSNGAISRYAVFTKKMKTVFADDDYNKDSVKKYIDRKNIFEMKINDYRHNSEIFESGSYEGIYSYGYEWTDNYDSIYNGKYNDTKKSLFPVWCICDHQNFTLLSYYEVKTRGNSSLPEKYDPEFTGYTIM